MLTQEQRFIANQLIPVGKSVECMQLALLYRQKTGQYVDWHEFSAYLDRLHTLGNLKVVGFTHAGLTLYELVV